MAGVRSDDSACSSVEAESAGSDFGSNAGCVAGTKFPGANRSVEQVLAGVNEVLQGSSEPPFRFHESVKKIELQCGFIRAFHVSAVSKMSFQMLCGKVARLQLSVFQPGVSIMQLLLCSPRDGFNVCCWLTGQMNASSKPPSGSEASYLASAPSRSGFEVDSTGHGGG